MNTMCSDFVRNDEFQSDDTLISRLLATQQPVDYVNVPQWR